MTKNTLVGSFTDEESEEPEGKRLTQLYIKIGHYTEVVVVVVSSLKAGQSLTRHIRS